MTRCQTSVQFCLFSKKVNYGDGHQTLLSLISFPADWREANRNFRPIFAVLLAVDLLLLAAFVAGNLLVKVNVLSELPGLFGIGRESSIAEMLNYLKWVACVGVLATCWWASRARFFVYLLVVFALILADDSLLIHETYGWTVAEVFGIPPTFGLDPKHIGEVVIFGLMGVIVLSMIGLSYSQAKAAARPCVLRFLLVIIGLAFSGVLFDAIHHASSAITAETLRRTLDLVLSVIEDGGEMIFASLAVSYSIGTWMEMRATPERF